MAIGSIIVGRPYQQLIVRNRCFTVFNINQWFIKWILALTRSRLRHGGESSPSGPSCCRLSIHSSEFSLAYLLLYLRFSAQHNIHTVSVSRKCYTTMSLSMGSWVRCLPGQKLSLWSLCSVWTLFSLPSRLSKTTSVVLTKYPGWLFILGCITFWVKSALRAQSCTEGALCNVKVDWMRSPGLLSWLLTLT